MAELTKAVILGTKFKKPVTLTHPEKGDTYVVYVRPLSDGEASLVESLATAGMKVQGDPKGGAAGLTMTMDLEQVVLSQAKANRKMVAMALCGDETWTEQEIEQTWPSTWVKQVAAEVAQLSGLELDSAEVKRFRGLTSGSGVAGTHATGDTAGS